MTARPSVSLSGAPDRALAYRILVTERPIPYTVTDWAREAERWHLAWESRRRYARQRRAAA